MKLDICLQCWRDGRNSVQSRLSDGGHGKYSYLLYGQPIIHIWGSKYIMNRIFSQRSTFLVDHCLLQYFPDSDSQTRQNHFSRHMQSLIYTPTSTVFWCKFLPVCRVLPPAFRIPSFQKKQPSRLSYQFQDHLRVSSFRSSTNPLPRLLKSQHLQSSKKSYEAPRAPKHRDRT